MPSKTKKKSKVSFWDRLAKRFSVDGQPAEVIVVFGLVRDLHDGWQLRWEAQSWVQSEMEGALPKGVGSMIIGAVREQLGEEFVTKMGKALEPKIVETLSHVGGSMLDHIGRRIARSLDGNPRPR